MDEIMLNDDNYDLFLATNYSNPNCLDINEFYEDLERIKYIKRLLNKYDKKKEIKPRLILNHIIVLQNVFGPNICSRILFYKIEEKFHSYLKSFLMYLNYLPESIPEVNIGKIPQDHKMDSYLRNETE
tara:strand:+ start:396 stop:779 length:384 start_codon:yes stop_codon:yes gene_type:complete